MFDKEMQAALIADGEKLAALTGTDHGPYFVSEKSTQTSDTTRADAFRNMFAILHNLDWWELVEGGVIRDANPMDQWDGFQTSISRFILRLSDRELNALYALVQSKQPAKYREGERAVDIARRLATRPLVAPQQDGGEEG